MRTLLSFVSSIVRRPTSCPCLSPETSSSPWSSSRKNSDEPSRARADGRAGSAPFGEDLGGRVRGMIMACRVSGFQSPETRRVVISSARFGLRRVTWCQISFVPARLLYFLLFSPHPTLSEASVGRGNSFLLLPFSQ